MLTLCFAPTSFPRPSKRPWLNWPSSSITSFLPESSQMRFPSAPSEEALETTQLQYTCGYERLFLSPPLLFESTTSTPRPGKPPIGLPWNPFSRMRRCDLNGFLSITTPAPSNKYTNRTSSLFAGLWTRAPSIWRNGRLCLRIRNRRSFSFWRERRKTSVSFYLYWKSNSRTFTTRDSPIPENSAHSISSPLIRIINRDRSELSLVLIWS